MRKRNDGEFRHASGFGGVCSLVELHCESLFDQWTLKRASDICCARVVVFLHEVGSWASEEENYISGQDHAKAEADGFSVPSARSQPREWLKIEVKCLGEMKILVRAQYFAGISRPHPSCPLHPDPKNPIRGTFKHQPPHFRPFDSKQSKILPKRTAECGRLHMDSVFNHRLNQNSEAASFIFPLQETSFGSSVGIL